MSDRAKIFTHGGSQAVRLPRAFRFDESEVAITREGRRVILEPVDNGTDDLWARLDALEAESGEWADLPDRRPSRPLPAW